MQSQSFEVVYKSLHEKSSPSVHKSFRMCHVYITYLLLYLFCSAEHAESPNVSCVARLNVLNGANGEEWWRLVQSSRHILPGNGSLTDLEMIIYSDRIAPPVFSAIAGFG